MAKSIDVCEIYGCTEIPQKGETICSSCWNRHDNSDLPGFPSEYDYYDDEQLNGCGSCNAPTNDWFCKSCYKTQEVICNRIAEDYEVVDVMNPCTCKLDYKDGCKCLPF
jgi:hypothetical protein